ncbi:FG-GAP-like repeat-containing protein [Roseimaritima ulvae]|nr:FG-GAP-like repeat-containing protein [Roseimaritima ulvae]
MVLLIQSERTWRIIAVLLFLLGFAWCTRPVWRPSPGEQLLNGAVEDLHSSRFAEAELKAHDAVRQDPRLTQAWLVAGDAARRQRHATDALRYYRSVPQDGSRVELQARCRLGEQLAALGLARQAEAALQRALEIDPEDASANHQLGLLLQKQGRTWESVPYVQRALLGGLVNKSHVMMLSAVDIMYVVDREFTQRCLATQPSDKSALIVEARQAIVEKEFDRAEAMLREIVAAQPELIEAQARLGAILFDDGDDVAFVSWQDRLPPTADEHPEIWYLRGLWARRRQQTDAAIRCFLEAARLDPNHSGAIFQLAQLLQSSEHAALAEQFAARSKTLSQMNYLLAELRELNDFRLIRKVVGLMDQLGRPLEAVAWCQVLQRFNPDQSWAAEEERRLAKQLVRSSDWDDLFTLPDHQLARRLDASKFPLPDWQAEEVKPLPQAPTGERIPQVVRFDDEAAAVGIDFRYYNGTTETTGLVHILQATGGGIAVVDFDQDNWPDLYFIQSGEYPIEEGQTQYLNRLYRNLGNGRFADVTATSGLGDSGYGQGVAVGDFNSDGFPDIYIANCGPNRLYENRGDGSFVEVPDAAGAGGDHWTTSCAIADLDGDALPEIYAANYALKDEVLKLKCKHEGKPRTCAPTLLTAEQDHLYRNLGNGRFANVTDGSGVVAADGKGLGVVIADFGNRGRPDIFVGNDTTANFFFRNQASGPEQPLRFREQAIVSGVGFDEVGNLQACMGVAAGDANADGLLDLFITNFWAESNILYQQQPGRLFADQTRSANLRDSGFHMLGFGTQFIDGELDGWPDLIIANGHIDRTFAHGNPDRMPPQYLRNTGAAQYTELPANELGDYFEGRYFGRALATVDWNRDGREDVCISHLDAPAALLTNRTEDAGNYLAVQLRGVQSNRDAIGTVVTLDVGQRSWMRQMVGGGGYLVSNQRQLLFGLGEADQVDRMTIRWPSGQVQTFENLRCNQQCLVVEGDEMVTLPAVASNP